MDYFYVYILKCSDGSYYTGHTNDLEYRLSQYTQKVTQGYVTNRLPFRLVYHEPFPTRDEALQAELRIKKWSRKKKEALINQDWKLLKKLAKKNF